MPRKPTPPDPTVAAARVALKQYLQTSKVRQEDLAARCGCSQSVVSKFLGGQVKSITATIERLLNLAGINQNIGIESPSAAADNRHVLDSALAKVWDGTSAHAQLLADIIVAVGPVLSRRTAPPKGEES